jgi:hypothetical protein
MAEKILHEVRLIETDDGFRIEIKGDKEKIKKMGFGHLKGFGRRMHHRRKARRARRYGHGYGYVPPWMWGPWDEDYDEDEEVEDPNPES